MSHHRFHFEICLLYKCPCPISLHHDFFDILDRVEDHQLFVMGHGTWHTIIPKEIRFLMFILYQYQRHNVSQIVLIYLFIYSSKSLIERSSEITKATSIFLLGDCSQ